MDTIYVRMSKVKVFIEKYRYGQRGLETGRTYSLIAASTHGGGDFYCSVIYQILFNARSQKLNKYQRFTA
jgi:hypothetical protein